MPRNMDVANRRVKRLQKEYEAQGYFVLTNRDFNTGVDILIFVKATAQLKKAIEVTNYKAEWEFILDDKLRRYIDSLNSFDVLPNVEKEIIVSFEKNLTTEQIREIKRNNIRLIIAGKQD